MRKRNMKASRKTLEWLHRRKGKAVVKMPSSDEVTEMRFFKIYGNGEPTGDGRLCGVGDFDESSGQYIIRLHAHGKNLMGGTEFMEIHKASKVSNIASVVSGFYSTTPQKSANGTPVIDSRHIAFKEKTAYTIAVLARYYYSSSTRDLRLRFDYTDGTYDFKNVKNASTKLYICISSDPEKTVQAIASHSEDGQNIRFNTTEFGIFEGAYTNFTEAFEAYEGERTELFLDAPLLGIGLASDELDLISGTVKRKIHTVKIDGDSNIREFEFEGAYEISLDVPMREGSNFISPFDSFDENEDCWIASGNEGEYICFKPSGEPLGIDEVREYLFENPFYITYIRKEPVTESVSASVSLYQKPMTLDILSALSPRKTVTEFV